jgi:AraC-like DNA-binding protein
MDRHDVSEFVTAEMVAQLHQEDLKIQDKFDCRGLTYWFDDVRKTAFCLLEAPNREAIVAMHKCAHGEVPHQIIEVDPKVVESFLGRIEDPESASHSDVNIISDPAFRTVMSVHLQSNLPESHEEFSDTGIPEFYENIIEGLQDFGGSLVSYKDDALLISFNSVTGSVFCASKIRRNFRRLYVSVSVNGSPLGIGIHGGVPVTAGQLIFEDAIRLAERLRIFCHEQIAISSEVLELYQSEIIGGALKVENTFTPDAAEERFITNFMEFTELEWQNTHLKVADFEQCLGYSKSRLYREMIRLTGKSPSHFLLHYRLQKSYQLIKQQVCNVSEASFRSGFNSPSYFARCFRKRYGITPSRLMASQTTPSGLVA